MRKLLLPSITGLFSLCTIFTTFGHAQALVHDRLAALSSHSERVAVPDSVAPRARRATDLGAADASTPLQSLTLRFSLTDSQNAALTQLLADQQNPASPSYHQWLTPEQYASQFGLSSGDLASVSTWLQAQGFTVTGVARSHAFISFAGTAGQVASAFGTTLHNVSSKGEKHLANLSDPTLPSALAGVVSGMTGLNDFKLQPHVHARTVAAPQFTSSISGNHFIAPGDFYTIYDINPLLSNSITGSGVTIGVMGQTDISLTDAAAFRVAAGLAAKAPTVKLYGTDPGTSSDDLEEAMLDVEWSGAVAPAANILFVNSTDVIAGSLTQAIDNNLAPILTISYGDCESGFGSANITTYNQLFRQANVQGQTILGPAGDSGATDCDYDATYATDGLAVDFPASSPNVTGIGGTMYNENGGTYFSSTNGTNAGSALSYIPEAVWNESIAGTGLGSGGGGVSSYFTKPSWQVGTGVPNDFSRDVPDISFNAAASHDGYLFCADGFCTNGFRNASNNLDVVGGTSVSTPAFAAILALLEQKIQARVGNANPTLYGLANSSYYASVFHDVTTGNNSSPCVRGSVNCPSGGSIGYSATTGYDLATGWGSIDVNNLVTDWLLVSPTGTTSTTGQSLSTTTLTASSTHVTSGTAVTVSVLVASGTQGVSTVPSGTVQLLVDNVATGSAVTLVNGAASLTLATTSLTSGGHLVTVAYSGDGNYMGSKGSLTVDVVSATAADFTLTPVTATATATSGGAAPGITFTVTPTNGFVGTVTFLASTTSSSLDATYAFSVNPVTISTTAAASTVLTLDAYTATGLTLIGQSKPAAAKTAKLDTVPIPAWIPLEVAGSGMALASLSLFFVPAGKRRRINALLVAVFSVGLLAMGGCSQAGVINTTSSTTTTSGSTTTNTTPGTYIVNISAYGTNAAGTAIAHTSTVTFVVH